MFDNILKNNKLTISIVIFSILFFIIVLVKPKFLFTKDGAIRNFGLGKRTSSIIPIWLVVLILAIFCYLFIGCC